MLIVGGELSFEASPSTSRFWPPSAPDVVLLLGPELDIASVDGSGIPLDDESCFTELYLMVLPLL